MVEALARKGWEASEGPQFPHHTPKHHWHFHRNQAPPNPLGEDFLASAVPPTHLLIHLSGTYCVPSPEDIAANKIQPTYSQPEKGKRKADRRHILKK